MSGKLPYSLREENPDLQKQMGCMTGIFQLFDRHHYLSSRHSGSHDQKRLPPGQGGNHGMEPSSMMQKTKEKNLKGVVKEKQRVSAESSRTSFSSSSCSSTFSSVDSSKIAQPEPSSLGHSIFPGNPSQILPITQPSSSSQLGKQSLDLRDVVKDSVCRETCKLSVKTAMKAKGAGRVVKNVDSPRPLQLSTEQKSPALPAKDAPRFSFDGRESRDKWKSAVKLKELPRLSLDSRERSIRKSASESTPNYLLDDLQPGNGMSSQILNPHQEPGSNKRPSSVVAKLMGLEALPDSTPGKDDQIRETKCCPDKDLHTVSISSIRADESKNNQASRSPRTLQKEPTLRQLRNVNPAVKPKSSFALEPAPWRQSDGNRGSPKQALIYQEAHTKAQNPWSSVYGDIRKRLTEIEFKRSGKDLRALKQILEAMEKTRERLENKKEDHASDLESQTSIHSSNYLNLHQNSTSAMQRSQIIPTRKTGHPKELDSSTVITRTAKVVQKPRKSGSSAIPLEGKTGLHKLRTRDNEDSRKDAVDSQTVKDLTPGKNHFRAPQHTSGGNPASSGRSSSTVSPRLKQKQHGMEKQSRPKTQTSDSSRARGHLTKQQIASSSSSRKFKPKSPSSQQSDDQLSDFSSETRQLSHQGDTLSEQSDNNLSLASQTDTEFTSTDRSKGSNGSYQHKDQKDEIAARLSKDRSKAEPTTATLEQPSPVSVLDTAFYREESPSPVKKISNAFIDEETLNSEEAEWSLLDLDHFLNSTRPNLSPQFDQEKLESITYLVRKLTRMNSTHDEASTDHIASLCENTNPEHRYITEILLASGILLKDLGSSSTIIQLHTSSYFINPNLFLVLEQTKGRIKLPDDDEHSNENIDQSKFNEKTHRKLIFDTVNEILFHKLTAAGYSKPWISRNKQGVRSLRGQKLLKELCSEIDHLQANPKCSLADEDDGLISISREDMIHQTHNWADYHTDVPGVVLDIERLIFKDLIGEIVSREAASLQGRPTKHHCRQLFST